MKRCGNNFSRDAGLKTTEVVAPHQQVKKVLWQVLLVNLMVAAAKIGVGLLTGSISMLADGFHSTTDTASNVLGLLGLALAERPPDSDHPYGHRKYETFATLGIGLLLLLTSWNILETVFTRAVEGGTPTVTSLSFIIMLVTMALNLLVTVYEKKAGHRLNSSLLLADAAHTQSDIFVSLAVLVSLTAAKLGWPWLDGGIAVLIVGVIGYTGWRIIQRASATLADQAAIDPQQVEQIVLTVAGVQSCHKIRSRGDEQDIHLDLHLQVDSHLSLAQAHHLGHLAQHRLQQELGVEDVLVHVEPK